MMIPRGIELEMNPVVSRLRALMVPEEPLSAAERLGLSLQLCDAGQTLMLQNLRRDFPDESELQLEERLVLWLQTRPGAELGDAEGTPSDWRPE